MTDAARKSPWIYRAYGADLAFGAFGPLEEFVEVWRKRCPAADRFPAWKDFTQEDFRGRWGQISVAELHVDPFDLRWVMWGTVITNWWGQNYTDTFISDIPAVRDVWENYEGPYIKRLRDERLIGYVTGTLAPQDRDYLDICGVDLPLETDGQVTHILSAYKLSGSSVSFQPAGQPVFVIGEDN